MKELGNYKQLTHEQKDTLIEMLWEQNQLLLSQNRELQVRISELEIKVKDLETKLNQNSQNSSKPPSSDGYSKPKPKNLRGKSGKNRGGQPGHQRRILEKHPNADKIIYHPLPKCMHCNYSLENIEPHTHESRQVFDIPPLKIEITEHRAEQKICPCCGVMSVANFPEDVQQETQYGSRIKGMATYLNQYQLLPYERLQELFKDIFNHTISQGMLTKINQQCYKNIEAADVEIKNQLQAAPHLHHDETSIRVDGKLHWCHVASTPWLTNYGIHPRRGIEGIETMGILSKFRGRLIHDFFRPYFTYHCQHALCNAHHLRELKFIEEECGQLWAKHMADLLLAIKKQVEWHQAHQLVLSPQRIHVYERCYDEIIMMGLWHPDNIFKLERKRKQGGYARQTKAKNLLDRLRFHRLEVLAFMYDHTIPFTNNQAEQDIRMLKVKQKVSGCFRSQEGAQWFARIKSYISTARKQGQNILNVLQDAFCGRPFIPQCP